MGYSLNSSQYTGTQGLSTATTSSTLTDSSQAWTVNAYAGCWVQSYSGGFPTRALVASNTATALTVTPIPGSNSNWDQGTPDVGREYVVSSLQSQVGRLFHVGFGNGNQWYGYILQPDSNQQSGGFHEKTDIVAKDQLIQYSSPNLIDRDITFWPRVSQGDFSGGMGQTVALDFTRYWDSTLDVRSPGYLTSWPLWTSMTVQGTLVNPGSAQVVSAGGKLFVTYGESNFHIYTVVPPSTVTTTALDIVAKTIDTDGYYIYVSDGTAIERRVATALGTTTTITNPGTVTIAQIWSIQQGTNGRWIFYTDQAFPSSSLYRVDLTGAFPSPGVQVPLGGLVSEIVDIVPYQTGVAILTAGGTAAGTRQGWDLWYFDGANTTQIFHREAYVPAGLTVSQGVLYISENPSIGTYGRTQLVSVQSGSETVVASLGTPPGYNNLASIGQPRAIGSLVYFSTVTAAVRNITAQYLVVYNPLTGSVFHTNDPSPMPTGFRTLSSLGETPALSVISQGAGSILYMNTGSFLAGGGSSIALVGSTGAIATAAAASVTPTFPQTPTTGNLLVLAATALLPVLAGTPAFSISGATGWLRAGSQTHTPPGLRTELWYKPSCTGASEVTPTVSCAGASNMSAELTEWSGAAALAVLDALGTASAANVGSLTITTSGPVAVTGEVGIAVFAETRSPANTGAWTPGGGWTNAANDIGVSQVLHTAVDYQLNPTAAVVLSETGTSSIAGPSRSWTGVTATFLPAAIPILYNTGGKLVTSRYDFSTPGIDKRFRRLEAIHAPIPTNCSLTIDCFIDKDPVAYTSGLMPDATVTNSRSGAVTTDFFLANLIGHSAYFVFTFTSSDNASSITLNWYSVEITTPLAWDMTLACTNARRLLTQQDDDSQGVTAKDLADFWRDAWENPKRLTMFARDGFAYTVALESFERWNPSPKTQTVETTRGASEEYFVKVTLRQTLADS